MQIKNVDFWDLIPNRLSSVGLEMGPGMCIVTASNVVLVLCDDHTFRSTKFVSRECVQGLTFLEMLFGLNSKISLRRL